MSTPNGTDLPVLTSPTLAGGRLLWLQTAADPTSGRDAIRSGALDGSGVNDLLPADSSYSPAGMDFTATDQAVTFQHRGARPSGGWSNAALPKLYQLPVTGGAPVRVSCNRGTQFHPAADQGTRVVWLDATPAATTSWSAASRPGPADHVRPPSFAPLPVGTGSGADDGPRPTPTRRND